jgi:hypothetical protein
MSGWIKLHRKVIEQGWLQHGDLWRFWCWCLLKASHKAINMRVGLKEVSLLPGQFVFGRSAAGKELRMSERTVRTCLTALKTTNNVTIETTSKFSIVTICNWVKYQSNESENDQQSDQQNDTQVTSIRPASDQQVTTNKNERMEECKNEKKKRIAPIILGEFKNVRLTQEEVDRFKAELNGDMFARVIQVLDEQIEEKGYKSMNHNLAIRKWCIKAATERFGSGGSNRTSVTPVIDPSRITASGMVLTYPRG